MKDKFKQLLEYMKKKSLKKTKKNTNNMNMLKNLQNNIHHLDL